MPVRRRVRTARSEPRPSARSRGSASSCQIGRISRGGPGRATATRPSGRRTNQPGAVPFGLGRALAEGMSQACLRLISGKGSPRRAHRSRSHVSSSGSTAGVSPQAAASASRVRSSGVGPRPPVETTRSTRRTRRGRPPRPRRAGPAGRRSARPGRRRRSATGRSRRRSCRGSRRSSARRRSTAARPSRGGVGPGSSRRRPRRGPGRTRSAGGSVIAREGIPPVDRRIVAIAGRPPLRTRTRPGAGRAAATPVHPARPERSALVSSTRSPPSTEPARSPDPGRPVADARSVGPPTRRPRDPRATPGRGWTRIRPRPRRRPPRPPPPRLPRRTRRTPPTRMASPLDRRRTTRRHPAVRPRPAVAASVAASDPSSVRRSRPGAGWSRPTSTWPRPSCPRSWSTSSGSPRSSERRSGQSSTRPCWSSSG